MADEAWPDVEAGVRAYLRTDTDVAAVVAGRVFFGVPKESPTFPLITLSRSGGGQDPSEATIDHAVLFINCWGGTKEQASTATLAVRKALAKIRRRTELATGVYAHGASVDGVIYSPDPTDSRPRYVVTARVTATAA